MLTVDIGTTIVGALAATFALWQYRKQNRQKRAEMFFQWNKWFDSQEGFGLVPNSDAPSMLQLLEDDDQRLAEVRWEKKEKLLAFCEEIALAVNSGLLVKETAWYMFGYYVLKIQKSKHFWKGFDDPNTSYWKLFHYFAQEMEKIEKANVCLKKLKF
jgi:hypothetical protein